jgi:hypothetical protein
MNPIGPDNIPKPNGVSGPNSAARHKEPLLRQSNAETKAFDPNDVWYEKASEKGWQTEHSLPPAVTLEGLRGYAASNKIEFMKFTQGTETFVIKFEANEILVSKGRYGFEPFSDKHLLALRVEIKNDSHGLYYFRPERLMQDDVKQRYAEYKKSHAQFERDLAAIKLKGAQGNVVKKGKPPDLVNVTMQIEEYKSKLQELKKQLEASMEKLLRQFPDAIGNDTGIPVHRDPTSIHNGPDAHPGGGGQTPVPDPQPKARDTVAAV